MFLSKRAATERLDRVAKIYLTFKFFAALYFAYPIFFQFASQTITPVQVGLFFSAIGICSFIAEVPTGIIADKHGRKRSGLLGMAILAIAPLIIFLGHTFFAYLTAALFYGLGRALMSGSIDALVYDHKNTSKTIYRRINALEITFGQAGILVGAAAGGLLFTFHQGSPFIADTIAALVCIVLIGFMHEQYKADFTKPTTSHRQHFIQSVRHLFATPYLRITVLMGVVFSAMLGMCIQFVNEAAMIEYGFRAQTRGLLISGAGVATLVILHLVILKVVRRDAARILYLTGGAAMAYTLMSIGSSSIFLVGYLVWHCLNATSSFIRVMIHDRIPSSHRSTILSNFKAVTVLAGLCASTATGMLVQWSGTPRAAYMVFGAISCFVLLPCAYWLIVHLKNEVSGSIAVPESVSIR